MAFEAAGETMEGIWPLGFWLRHGWVVLGCSVVEHEEYSTTEPPAPLAISHQDYDSCAHSEEMEMTTIFSWKRASGKRILIGATTNE